MLSTDGAFLTMFCQQSRSGRGVDAKWVAQSLGITKKTAISKMAEMVKTGHATMTETSWRSNALKFWYYPTDKVWDDYHKKLYRAEYLKYMRRMMEA